MASNERDIFVNCPFDDAYKPIFNSIVYTVTRFGYRVRCALETDDASDNRLNKICGIIAECRFGIHDISRTEADGDPPLPRFNMPLELGLFLGAKRYGSGDQKKKVCMIFDREPFRFQRYISDIAGQDIHAHGGDWKKLIRELSTWLRAQPGNTLAGGGAALAREYEAFVAALPAICAMRNVQPDELSFRDFNEIVIVYVAALVGTPTCPSRWNMRRPRRWLGPRRFIEGTLGEGTYFQKTFRYHVDAVSARTAVFPADWQTRASQLKMLADPDMKITCPSAEDIGISKCVAWRQKDKEWLRLCARHGLIDLERMRELAGRIDPADLGELRVSDIVSRIDSFPRGLRELAELIAARYWVLPEAWLLHAATRILQLPSG